MTARTSTEVQRPPMFALVDQFKWRDEKLMGNPPQINFVRLIGYDNVAA